MSQMLKSSRLSISVATLGMAAFAPFKENLHALEVSKNSPAIESIIKPETINTAKPPWESHVVPNQTGSSVAIGKGIHLTSAKLGAPEGAKFVREFKYDSWYVPDLIIYYLESEKDKHAEIPFAKESPEPNQALVVAGPNQAGLHCYQRSGYYDGGKGDQDLSYNSFVYSSRTHQLQNVSITERDIGGPVFKYDPNSNQWQLSGIIIERTDAFSANSFDALSVDLSDPSIHKAVREYRKGIRSNSLKDNKVKKVKKPRPAGVNIFYSTCAAAISALIFLCIYTKRIDATSGAGQNGSRPH